MAFIRMTGVGIDFQVLDGVKNRMLHPEFFREFIGGKMGLTESNKLFVSALDNIDLKIEAGGRLGLLGHNGSGKSTLLRVMAGVYAPTRGVIESEGRISTLFDISIGMDMDINGRDNIRLQSLIFGMSPEEIERVAPQIEEFTELRDFLDLPVRTYSTGMKARLSFGVATALQPDILLLDEVIGAGDSAFMERATERLEILLERPNILVLASHSNDTLRRFCDQGLVLEKGNLVFYGDIEDAITAYEQRVEEVTADS